MPQLTTDRMDDRAGVFASTHLGRRCRCLPRWRRCDSDRRRPDRRRRRRRRDQQRGDQPRHARRHRVAGADRCSRAHGARSGSARSAVADQRRQIDARRCHGATRGGDGARWNHDGARPRRRRMARTRVARPYRSRRGGRSAAGVRRTTRYLAAGPLLLLGRRSARCHRCRGGNRPSARTRRRSDQSDGDRRHDDEGDALRARLSSIAKR